ncbi:uncharacterized protein isoform X2 [Musca autumnalis]
MRRLSDLDLSYNRLEYLDERLFERNRHLENLNLEGNKFMSISHKPLLKSSSLRILSLRNSQLSFIPATMLDDLPNLTELDLSKNLLNTWRVEDFEKLRNLSKLKLSHNVFKCNAEIQSKIDELKAQKPGITVDIDECISIPRTLSLGVEKFQKMVMLDQPETVSEATNIFKQWRLNFESEEEIDDDDGDRDIHFEEDDDTAAHLANNEWLRFAPDAVLCDTDKYKLCHNYRQCLVNLNTAWHEKRSMDSFVSSETKFAFFLGSACGITLVICILTCALCVKNCCESKRKDHLSEIIHSGSGDLNGQQPLARQQLPPQVRRQPRRRGTPSHPPHQRAPVVRYEGPVAENFISRLFGRPARRQYYRTINQNTATLIRRLSRSNLFNNRLSQHFTTDRQNSTDANGAESSHFSPSAPRPETPPPCYGDVVVSDCEEGRK